MKKRTRKIFLSAMSWILTLSMLLGVLPPVVASADSEADSEAVSTITPDTSWYNDTDTEFTLTTAEQMYGLAELVNGGNPFVGKTIKLGGDIDLTQPTPAGEESLGFSASELLTGTDEADTNDSGVFAASSLNVLEGDESDDEPAKAEWTPIGTTANPFKGTFDGGESGGHKVTIYITSSDANQGLFGYVNSATINDVTVDGEVTGGQVHRWYCWLCFRHSRKQHHKLHQQLRYFGNITGGWNCRISGNCGYRYTT